MPLWDSLRFVTFSSSYPPQQRLFKGSAWDIVVAKRTNYNPISVRLHMCLRSSLRLLCKLAVKELQASLLRLIFNWRPENVLPNHSTQKQSLKPIKYSHQSTLPAPSAVKSMRGSPKWFFYGQLSVWRYIAVLCQFCCEVITLCLNPYTKCAGRAMKKIS